MYTTDISQLFTIQLPNNDIISLVTFGSIILDF